MSQTICCWNTECIHNERYKQPHPTFVGYCKKDTITIGRKGTQSVKCYDSSTEVLKT